MRLSLLLSLLLVGLTHVPGAAESASPLKRVVFTFRPETRYERVFLAGTWNGWSETATAMRRVDDGFEIVLPLSLGEHQYKFVADGEWLTDETAGAFHPDGYGGRNSVVVVDESFPAFELARGDGRVMADGIGHGQDAWERSRNADGSIALKVRVWAGDVERVAVALDARDAPLLPAEWYGSDGTFDYYAAAVDSSLAERCRSYRFLLEDGPSTLWLGRDGVADDAESAGWFALDAALLAPFDTPQWVRDGVVYQIFPERFANGTSENDPDMSEWYYEGAKELPASGKTNGEYFHLVTNWYDIAGLTRSPYRTDGRPDWNSFYGGDIEGIRRNLDYLSELGVTVVYLNPIFTSKSNHKYDAASYMEIDPHFGTNDEFARFVRECHDRGIRVVIDLAFNHTGHTFWAFVDARERGRESPTWDWYEWNKWPVPGDAATTPMNAEGWYDCWAGFGQMPNLNFDLSRPNAQEPPIEDVARAVPNQPLVEHLLGAADYWVREAGVDGYRLDVAQEVPRWFWGLFREKVKAAKPDAYIVGEIWGEAPEWIGGRSFDAVMNYKFFREPVLEFIARGAMTAPEFDRALAPGRFVYPEPAVRAMMNLLGSHDTERFLTAAGGDVRRLKLAVLFSMTYVGVPTIYYGDEIATTGVGDPDCRRPFDWRWSEEPGRVDVHDTVVALAAMRKRLPCFADGRFETLYAEDSVFAFRRASGECSVVVVLNAGENEAEVVIPLGPAPESQGAAGERALTDELGGPAVPVASQGGSATATVTLAPLSGVVLRESAPRDVPGAPK